MKEIPISNILIVLNACLIENKVPTEWKCGRTTLIPKTQKAAKPELFRPITVTSLWIRLLNKILSAKVTNGITLNPAQLGFQKLDGTAIGCLKLDRAFKNAKKNAKSLSVITIDFEKAFDSVSHNSIARSIKRFGLPEWLLHLIQDMYKETTSTIGSVTATVKRGIKQGDPLSSTLFNMVIDELIEKIAKMRLGPRSIPEGVIAYADDIVLIAQSAIDSELMLKTLETEAKMVGLKIKPTKCNYINWENVPKKKKIAITEEKQINLQNGTIKHLKPDKSFKYLGADINIHGIARIATIGQFKEKLQLLSHAPLKPQQRLFYVRNYLIPGLQHTLALMRVTKTELLNYDKCLRYHAKRMLKLPKDVHNAILHTNIRQGGLGIPSIFTRASVLISTRTAKAKAVIGDDEPPPKWVTIRSKSDESQYWYRSLENSVDGKHLSLQKTTMNSNLWISEPTKLLSGADYIRCIKIRTNSVMTKSRQARMYQNAQPMCTAGCRATESLNHIVQKCPRNYHLRNRRHDKVLKLIEKILTEKNLRVRSETAFNCNPVGLKPDLLITSGTKTYIADLTIISDTDAAGMNKAYNEKVYKYTKLDLYDQVKTLTSSTDVEVVAIVISYRGVIEPRSALFLKQIGVNMSDLKLVTVRTLERTIVVWKNHYRSTIQRWDVVAPND